MTTNETNRRNESLKHTWRFGSLKRLETHYHEHTTTDHITLLKLFAQKLNIYWREGTEPYYVDGPLALKIYCTTLIYYFRNKKFRRAFRRSYRLLPCGKSKESTRKTGLEQNTLWQEMMWDLSPLINDVETNRCLSTFGIWLKNLVLVTMFSLVAHLVLYSYYTLPFLKILRVSLAVPQLLSCSIWSQPLGDDIQKRIQTGVRSKNSVATKYLTNIQHVTRGDMLCRLVAVTSRSNIFLGFS